MAEAVYILCAITSAVCAGLLFNGYRSSRTGLLFWSSLCFAGLTINNFLLYLDRFVFANSDMSLIRSFVALAAMGLLLFGLVWETR